MHYERFRRLIGCGLFLVLSFSSLSMYGGTCDQAAQFNNGLLSIQSNGCSLQQLLQAVQSVAGIEVEIPTSAAMVPVVINIDPGQPAAVITSLLSVTKYNYYLVASEQNGVARVVISEVTAAPATLPQAAPVAQPATAPAKSATSVAKKENTKKKHDKEKEDKLASNDVIESEGDMHAKPELDESTLRGLPQLPPGLPAAMWRLYPEIVQNGGIAPNAPLTMANGVPIPAQPGADTATSFYPQDPPALPKGVVGLPTLPPDIDPNMGKIYPWNLMQTLNGPITYPNIVLPPMAPPIGGTPSHP